jgi:3-hydroxyacyl-CoA dehydrogenase
VSLSVKSAERISLRLQAAIYRESLALVEADVAGAADIDRVITNSIGRRWSVGGPFEIWEQIGWDLVQVIAGELIGDISIATSVPEIPDSDALESTTDAVDRDTTALESKFQDIAVIGAGLLGHGIALELAASGKRVYLNDVSDELLADAMAKARVGLSALASVGRIVEADIESIISRISISTSLRETVHVADLVIEAASENLELKKSIFTEIDAFAPANAILASNSSTFVPGAYGSDTSRSSQILGIHYFNPPHLLPGIEIIKGPNTSNDVVDLVIREFEAVGKKPALVRTEIQGFISNRLQVALLRQAMSEVESGNATPSEVDEIVRSGFGRQLASSGIFGSLSHVDLPITHYVLSETFAELNNERELPRLLLDKIDSGELGVKVGKGFYDWTPESAEEWRANMADSLLHMGWN